MRMHAVIAPVPKNLSCFWLLEDTDQISLCLQKRLRNKASDPPYLIPPPCDSSTSRSQAGGLLRLAVDRVLLPLRKKAILFEEVWCFHLPLAGKSIRVHEPWLRRCCE